MIEKIRIIDGGLAIDDRGTLAFANGFNHEGIKRFYQVSNFSQNTIRAFHGHLREAKYVYPAKGTILLAAVFLDDFQNPSKDNLVQRFVLSDRQPRIIYIPPGYANGFRALEDNASVIFFSTVALKDSGGDDYRFPYDYWGEEVWQVENR